MPEHLNPIDTLKTLIPYRSSFPFVAFRSNMERGRVERIRFRLHIGPYGIKNRFSNNRILNNRFNFLNGGRYRKQIPVELIGRNKVVTGENPVSTIPLVERNQVIQTDFILA